MNQREIYFSLMRSYLHTLLPKNVTVRKECYQDETIYIFNHTELDELGAIAVRGTGDKKTQISALTSKKIDILSKKRERFFKSFAEDIILEASTILENAPPHDMEV